MLKLSATKSFCQVSRAEAAGQGWEARKIKDLSKISKNSFGALRGRHRHLALEAEHHNSPGFQKGLQQLEPPKMSFESFSLGGFVPFGCLAASWLSDRQAAVPPSSQKARPCRQGSQLQLCPPPFRFLRTFFHFKSNCIQIQVSKELWLHS